MINKKVIVTRHGDLLNLIDPDPEMIYLTDIAHGLANTARFNGQTKSFYSVAEHSVFAAFMAISAGMSQEMCRKVLLHDAAEAYIGDMVKPLKVLLPEFSKIEAGMMAAIYYRFGLKHNKSDDKTIKLFDDAMLYNEQKYVLNFQGELPFGVNHTISTLTQLPMWQPELAVKKFVTLATGSIIGLSL